MSPACRTPNAAIPPIRPRQPSPRPPPATDHRPTPGRLPAQPPLTGPHPAANGGFCTIRHTATACRRRVAALMLQFPPFARANHGPARHHRPTQPPTPGHNSPQPRPRPPPATAHRPTPHRQRGFCTIRRTPTACRRRVAPLMLQFPPFARANHGHARHQRRPTRPRPRASQSPGATGAPFKPYPLFRQNEIRPIQFVQTATN